MDNTYYECTVKYDKMQETGLMKKVSEKYLVEALSFSEAEKRVVEEMVQYVSGDLDVAAIRRTSVREIFESSNDAADRWYKAKLAFITLDERTAQEKRTLMEAMVHACDIDDARAAVEEGMKGTLGDWLNIALSETPVVDLLRHSA